MIINKQKALDYAVDATLQPLNLRYGDNDSRFLSIVDDNGHECAPVTGRYRLVRNSDSVHAVDLVADKLNVDLVSGDGFYGKGKYRQEYRFPDTFKVPGDASNIHMSMTLTNGYGANSLGLSSGAYRLICTNGMSIGEILTSNTQKHVGNFDLMELIEEQMLVVIARANKHQLAMELAAQTEYEFDRENNQDKRDVINLIAESTPKRYHPALRDSINNNRAELGNTAWAIIQAISEVATHDMKGANRHEWERKQSNRIYQYIGAEV